MKVSVNWLKQLVDFDLPATDTLVEKIGAQLGAVEEVVDLSEKYQGIIVAKVVSCEKHPAADKLSLCMIDDGGKAKDVDRNNDGLVQVVCGAPNVRADMLAAWLPPGATVPSTYGKDPFVLEARELRGSVSNGMLASPKELALGDSHEGILEVDKNANPGEDFAALFKLDDQIIDIENKMFTHRPDCFGALGVAREIAGILGKPFKSPDWYVAEPNVPVAESDELKLTVKNELPDLAPRFTAVTMAGVTIGPSPTWLQVALAKVGQKPVNNIVDLTNFYMLVTGQPLHAYDYDKVKALSGGEAALVVRQPKKGEKIKLLNGKEVEPRAEAIMIATDKQLIGIGGVMGGSETEVDADTKNIILECANFDMYSIRRTSMAHGLFTNAVTRFTKGQSVLQCAAVSAEAVQDIQKLAGGQVAGEFIDIHGTLPTPPAVTLSPDFINARLGLALDAETIDGLLTNVEFKVDTKADELTVTVPFWRTDIEIPEDIVEEVGRLYGYDHLPLELPKRDLTPAPKDPLLQLKSGIRNRLSRAGANELLTYSFVHGDLLAKAGQDKTQAFELSNALSPDLQYYRLSLTPSLLEKVHPNIKAGYQEFALFEIGKAHVASEPDPQDANVPKEVNALSLVYASKRKTAGAPYYQAKKLLTDLVDSFGTQRAVQLQPLQGADLYNNPWVTQMTAPFEPQRSAVLRDEEGLIWGVVGEFKPSVSRSLKLPVTTAGFEVDPLLLQSSAQSNYVALPRFPRVKQDITLQVPADMPHQDLINFFRGAYQNQRLKNVDTTLSSLDIYQPDESPGIKRVTLHFTIASYERTLTDTEVNKLLDDLAAAAREQFKAERV